MSPVLVVIGAGPREAGLLERLVENLPAFPGASEGLALHVVDPHPPGPGRIWRGAQSPLLKLNSMAQDVTMFTDESSTIEGPLAPGPNLIEWAELVRSGALPEVQLPDAALAAEIEALAGTSFPTRRLQSLYLRWFHERAAARLPDGVELRHHATTAVDVEELPGGSELVRLADGTLLEADAVVYALGHTGVEPEPEHAALADFATRHGLAYLPPAYTADAELSAFEPDQDVIVRGMGLVAVDLVVLLTEGRGGVFAPGSDGRLAYTPSGREPHLVLGSRRGVPYHSKITSQLAGRRPERSFFDAAAAAQAAAEHPALDFREHVWPLIAKEMLNGYYAELFTGHPERVAVPWEEFEPLFAPLDPFGDELAALVARTVLDPADRLDLAAFDRPLAGFQAYDRAGLQDQLRAYIRADLHRRTAPEHSETLGLFTSLLLSMFAFAGIADAPNWTPESWRRDLLGWWHGYFSYVASGPPGHRLEELLALSEAGVVEFLGSELVVEADEDAGVFRARGANSPHELAARALIDARLPEARAAQSDSAVLRSLLERGSGVSHVIDDGAVSTDTGRIRVGQAASVTRPDGTAHPRRFAIGPYTTAPHVGAFARPRTNAVSFRENDAVARAVLALLLDLGHDRSAPHERGILQPRPPHGEGAIRAPGGPQGAARR